MGIHTKRSPSQAKRSKLCHGALAICEALDPFQKNQSGPAAKLGTAVHGLIEHCLTHGVEPETMRDRIIELVGDEENCSILRPGAKLPGVGRVFFEVDDDMIDGADVMCGHIWRRCEELGIDPMDREALQTESRTNPLPDRDDTSGTADVTIDAWPVVLEVDDYKNGWNLVEHNDNEQLRAYLLGKALEAQTAGFEYESYRITVVQPNAPHDEGKIRSVDYTLAELLEFQAEYRDTIHKCEAAENAKGAPQGEGTVHGPEDVDSKWAKKYLNAAPTGEQCMFCDAAPICPARRKLAQTQAEMDFTEAPGDLPEPTTELAASEILAWAPHMEKLIAQAAVYAQRALENGHHVPGQKLVRKTGHRQFIEMVESKLIAAIVKGGYIKDRALLFTKPKLLTAPAAEKLVPAKLRKAFEAKFMIKPETGLTIAPEADKREAVIANVGDDFNDDESEFG